MCDEAAEARIFERGRGTMAGKQIAGTGVVISKFVRQRSNQRHLAHHLRRQRQVLANAHASHACGDVLERTAHFARRIGLWIERVEVARTAIEPEQDAGLCARRRISRAGLEPQQILPRSDRTKSANRGAENRAVKRHRSGSRKIAYEVMVING
jgi:hypothetical protein